MLYRVMRTPNISDTSVTISARHGGLEETPEDPDQEDGLGTEGENQISGAGEGEQDESGDAGAEGGARALEPRPPGPYEFVGPVPEDHVWPDVSDEALIGDESTAGSSTEEQDEEPEQETEVEEESPAVSALEIEKLVEERLAEFETRFQREKEEAYKSGFEDGKAEGTREGLQQSVLEVDRFCALIDAVRVQWDSVNKGHDTILTDLAVSVASRIVGAAVEVSSDTVIRAVQDSLGYLTDKSRVIIRVNPDDLSVVREHRAQWLESLESLERLVIESSSTITRGGCVIESLVGDVDAQIEERLERMRIALLEAVRTQESTADTLPVPGSEAAAETDVEGNPDDVEFDDTTLIGAEEEPGIDVSIQAPPSTDSASPAEENVEESDAYHERGNAGDEHPDGDPPPETPNSPDVA